MSRWLHDIIGYRVMWRLWQGISRDSRFCCVEMRREGASNMRLKSSLLIRIYIRKSLLLTYFFNLNVESYIMCAYIKDSYIDGVDINEVQWQTIQDWTNRILFIFHLDNIICNKECFPRYFHVNSPIQGYRIVDAFFLSIYAVERLYIVFWLLLDEVTRYSAVASCLSASALQYDDSIASYQSAKIKGCQSVGDAR